MPGAGGGGPGDPPAPTTPFRVEASFSDATSSWARCTYYTANDSPTPLAALLLAIRAASACQCTDATIYYPTTAPASPYSAGPYSAHDKLHLNFVMSDGSRSSVVVPDPLESLFFDDESCDPESVAMASAYTSLSAVIVSPGGSPPTRLASARRSRRGPRSYR